MVPQKCVLVLWGICDAILNVIIAISTVATFLGLLSIRASSRKILSATIVSAAISIIFCIFYSRIRNYVVSNFMVKSKWIHFELEQDRLDYVKSNYSIGIKIIYLPVIIINIYLILFA